MNRMPPQNREVPEVGLGGHLGDVLGSKCCFKGVELGGLPMLIHTHILLEITRYMAQKNGCSG